MNTWFTADTHFGHANIIKYCNRPFANSVEMDKALIANWNARVGKNDLIYHVGDFCFQDFDRYFNQLNGLKIFVKGNHDRNAWQNRDRFYSHSDSYREICVNGQDITLCHYAMRVWNKSHYGSWNLYGHSHGSLPDDPHARAIDIGVDCHNFAPISFDEVAAIMEKKLWKPIDHHTGRLPEGGIGLSKAEYEKAERRKLYEQLKKEFEP